MSTIYRHGTSLVVPIPPELLSSLKLTEGAEVSVVLDAARGQIVIAPLDQSDPEIDETFAQQLTAFIEQYRPALEALAK